MVSELTVTVKDEENAKILKKKFLLHDPYSVDETDPTIKNCIEETLHEFQSEPDGIKVNIVMEIE
jgi:hypothetical protein